MESELTIFLFDILVVLVYLDQIFCLLHHRSLMTQCKLTGAKLFLTLLERTITLNGQLELERENLTFLNLKMLA